MKFPLLFVTALVVQGLTSPVPNPGEDTIESYEPHSEYNQSKTQTHDHFRRNIKTEIGFLPRGHRAFQPIVHLPYRPHHRRPDYYNPIPVYPSYHLPSYPNFYLPLHSDAAMNHHHDDDSRIH